MKLYAAELRASLAPAALPNPITSAIPADPRNVFVVHGRNVLARDAVFALLRSLGLQPIEWDRARALTGKPNPYVGEILDAAFGHAGAVVVVLTGDDEVRLRPAFRSPTDSVALEPQARPNVIFECGIAFARDPNKTVVVRLGTVRPFTDFDGLHILDLKDDARSRKEFAARLQSAKCPVDMSGSDFLEAGDVASALAANQEPFPQTLAPNPQWLSVAADSGTPSHCRLIVSGDQTSTEWRGYFWVTNRTNELVRIVRVDVVAPDGQVVASGQLDVRDPDDQNGRLGSFELPPGKTLHAAFSHQSRRVLASADDPYEALVVFTDALERTRELRMTFNSHLGPA